MQLSYNLRVPKTSRAGVTFELVRRTALSLPQVTEGSSYRYPAFRTHGKVFLCLRQDLNSILVRTTFDQRDDMIATSPEIYFTTDHHRPHPWVLAHLETLDVAILPDLLRMGWQAVRRAKK